MIVSSQLNETSNESQPETKYKRFRKPRFDTYTMMLLVSLIAIALAITCLYLTMETYEWKFRLKKDYVTQIESPVEGITTFHV